MKTFDTLRFFKLVDSEARISLAVSSEDNSIFYLSLTKPKVSLKKEYDQMTLFRKDLEKLRKKLVKGKKFKLTCSCCSNCSIIIGEPFTVGDSINYSLLRYLSCFDVSSWNKNCAPSKYVTKDDLLMLIDRALKQ